MGLELPGEVTWFLGVIGVKWPQVNEDHVRHVGDELRRFGAGLMTAHHDATATVDDMGHAYQGASYEALRSMWQGKSTSHINDLHSSCASAGTIMNVAADAILAAKAAAIAELIGLAAAYIAAEAAAAATFGASKAAERAIIQAAKRCVSSLVNKLESYLLSEVLGKAVQPIEDVVRRAAVGLVFGHSDGARSQPSSGGLGASVSVDSQRLAPAIAAMGGHAEAVRALGSALRSALAGVSFQ